jgi:hypothetical protein
LVALGEPEPCVVKPRVCRPLRTNTSGNAREDVFVEPGDVEDLAGVHGVMWTVRTTGEVIAYQTTCTAVTLD